MKLIPTAIRFTLLGLLLFVMRVFDRDRPIEAATAVAVIRLTQEIFR